jgi:RHS repeat-associated protein
MVKPGRKLEISKVFTDGSALTAGMAKGTLDYTTDDDYYMAGMRSYYFGARYYDPEVGVWGSRDAAGQFYNAYGYGNDPVLFVDPDRMWMKEALAWIGGVSTMGLNAGLYAGYQSILIIETLGVVILMQWQCRQLLM